MLLVSVAVRTPIKAILRPANDHYILPPRKRASVAVAIASKRFGEPAGGGGAEGTRTPDIRLAKAALSQLSYGPGPAVAARWANLDSNQGPQSYQDCALAN